MIILSAPFNNVQATIYLPSPLFNDSVTAMGQIDRKVSMSNVTYTYVKRITRRELKFTLELHRQKAFELQAFVEVYLTEDVRVKLDDGDLWRAKFVSNPFNYTTVSKNDILTIDLEMQGSLVYGSQSDC